MKTHHASHKSTYILRLLRGEDVFQTLAHFCERERVSSATFSAIGAITRAKVGYYDLATKQYGSKLYEEDYEVASMTGNVALVDGKPFLHIHAVLSGISRGTENQCIGGHVFEATVAVTLEVFMTAFSEPIERMLDETIGLKLLHCRESD